MKKIILISAFASIFLILNSSIQSQDYIDHVLNPVCGTDLTNEFCNGYSSYFPMSDDTLRALVVFANYPDGSWDPVNINSNLIYMQYWPGTNNQHLQKPSWADSVICPTTTNVWNPSLTGLLKQSSNGKFWLIGDVYPDLVILDHEYEYYTPVNGRRIGTVVKEIIDKINPDVNFADYDKFDPCDIDNDGNRREPDGTVDFIFVVFRFIISSETDEYGYTGIAELGGINGVFGNTGDSIVIMRDNKKIRADYPGSGCICEMSFKWMLGIPEHECVLHYGMTGSHLNGLGNHSINGGGIASAFDREHFNWTSGNIYQPTSNTTNITLRDYVTTGDYIKINRNQKTYYIENRRRLNYYSTDNIHSWRWTMNEQLLPYQRDSGLLIYQPSFKLYHAYGMWNFARCQNGKYKIIKPPYYNEFLPESVSRYTGMSIMDLTKLPVADYYCNPVYNNYFVVPRIVDSAFYIGVEGDSNMCFDVNYNMVFSPWSNPGIIVNSSSDSLTIELAGRNEDGSLSVDVYFNTITQASPSKPQYIKAFRQVISTPPDAFITRLTWLKNKEPDIKEYIVYRGQITGSEEDASAYNYLGTTQDTFFVDNRVLYMHNSGQQPCPRYEVKFVYRVSAVDSSDKESVKSDRDSMTGYTDPCGAEEESIISSNEDLNQIQLKNSLSQNYPNPFNPVTRINYTIENDGNVKINLYDISGRLVKTLLNQYKISGEYKMILNTDDLGLSSGVYFYRIEADNFIETRKLFLIK